jgi:hypothetical protein
VTVRSANKLLIPAAVAACVAQLMWFGSKVIWQIDYDGMAYTGIAEQVRLGHFRESLNAFRSPLISWLIALVPTSNVLVAGKLVTILTFSLTITLVYVFSLYLWRSHAVSATAALLMTLARGMTFLAVAFVTPDFLFTGLVLAYFVVLLRCLNDERHGWWVVGLAHATAFLAKAIALPWLAVCTMTSVLLSHGAWKIKFERLASAAVLPIIFAALWAVALHTRYGQFTVGSQFKTNLLQWTLRGIPPEEPSQYMTLVDVARRTNGFVDDPIPPGSWEWSYHPKMSVLVPRILSTEVHNVPRAIKEFTIMSTPGILLAVLVVIWTLRRHYYGSTEWVLAITIGIGAVVLVLAYSMLVIDSRYLFPILALVFALGARALWPGWEFCDSHLRMPCIALTSIGIVFSLFYWASPFRTQIRDWQIVCRETGMSLRLHSVATTVSIGSGPFPDHGVGWEAGYISSLLWQSEANCCSRISPSRLTQSGEGH